MWPASSMTNRLNGEVITSSSTICHLQQKLSTSFPLRFSQSRQCFLTWATLHQASCQLTTLLISPLQHVWSGLTYCSYKCQYVTQLSKFTRCTYKWLEIGLDCSFLHLHSLHFIFCCFSILFSYTVSLSFTCRILDVLNSWNVPCSWTMNKQLLVHHINILCSTTFCMSLLACKWSNTTHVAAKLSLITLCNSLILFTENLVHRNLSVFSCVWISVYHQAFIGKFQGFPRRCRSKINVTMSKHCIYSKGAK